MSAERADALAEAAALLRANGYAVVTKAQAEHWDRWLAESHARERQLHDQEQRLIWMVCDLMHRCQQLLEGRRPTWWRELRRAWRDSDYRQPIVLSDPALRR